MASNSFGQRFRITTFGESHGIGVGVVIDGCPAGLEISHEEIERALEKRRPGKSPYTSMRSESDCVEILSGLFEGKTTGAPLTLFIKNNDIKSSHYEAVKDLYRPGHANFTYLQKYGTFDYRGGGRASARETAARVAAGAVAKKLLSHFEIECMAFLQEAAGVVATVPSGREEIEKSPIFCPGEQATQQIQEKLEEARESGDSWGGVVGCIAKVPAGLGEPIYCKMEALLAFAMLSIPASKGFEIGSGFEAARMQGSEHNDLFDTDGKSVFTKSNQSGGTLGGISTGEPLTFRVAFKPTSSIKKPQETVSLSGEKTTFALSDNSRHDPCVAIRAVPVVEAMTALVLADALLMHQTQSVLCSKQLV